MRIFVERNVWQSLTVFCRCRLKDIVYFLNQRNSCVGKGICSRKKQPDFSINILASFVGNKQKTSSVKSNTDDITMRGNNVRGASLAELITLREVANEAREIEVQDRMDQMEKLMEKLTAILYEHRDG